MQKIITLLFLSGEPMSLHNLSKLSNENKEDIEKLFPQIKSFLNQGGLDLLVHKEEVSIVTKSEFASLIENFWTQELKGELTPAALQVLTLVAYLDKPTRADISFVRGVQSSQSIRTLSVRGLIKREGEICSLTSDALKHLGVTSIEELPEYEKLHIELLEKLESVKKE